MVDRLAKMERLSAVVDRAVKVSGCEHPGWMEATGCGHPGWMEAAGCWNLGWIGRGFWVEPSWVDKSWVDPRRLLAVMYWATDAECKCRRDHRQ